MVAQLIIKQVRNLSDESMVEQWSENLYYQYLVVNLIFDQRFRARLRSWLPAAIESVRQVWN
jgi:hypothetical protein